MPQILLSNDGTNGKEENKNVALLFFQDRVPNSLLDKWILLDSNVTVDVLKRLKKMLQIVIISFSDQSFLQNVPMKTGVN